MSNDGSRQDQVWPQALQWDLGPMSAHSTDRLWKCDVMRAGKVYSSSVFGTQAEAEGFADKLRATAPDQMFRVQAILASAVWN